MSLSAKSAIRSSKPNQYLRDRVSIAEAEQEIRDYLEGCIERSYWNLSQEEADELANNRLQFCGLGDYGQYTERAHERAMEALKKRGKSAGARYIAARILRGAEPDLKQLTQDWFAHRNILKELNADELNEIGACSTYLRELGIRFRWEARAFYNLYRQVRIQDRVWNSSCQVNLDRVKYLALTPNYNRLPLWVKEVLINSPHWIQTERIGDIWRLIDCAKAWKWCPTLPKGIAERVGRMSPRTRMIASLVWQQWEWNGWASARKSDWMDENDQPISRLEQTLDFWKELREFAKKPLAELVELAQEKGWSHGRVRQLVEKTLKLPHQFLWEKWGRKRDWDLETLQGILATYGTPQDACLHLFGCQGKATVRAFEACQNKDVWQWASAIAYGNPDALQKILALPEVIAYQPDAVAFLKTLPMQSRIRLLSATTFKYRGQVQPISDDHVRDTGYLWSNIQNKPELGRVRCWFSVHEQLAAAFVKELPDEALPIPAGWERVDGLASVSGEWELEFPKRVATLKFYGQVLHNCVGGYGPAIKSGRSVVFVVREYGQLTHCVEVCNGHINQFYQTGNTSADSDIEWSVTKALQQAGLII